MGRMPRWYTGQERKYQIKRLMPRHIRVLRLLAEGRHKIKDIAAETGYSREMISIIANSKIGHDYLDKLNNDLLDDFIAKHRYWLTEVTHRPRGKHK